jgi:hypothetical protein
MLHEDTLSGPRVLKGGQTDMKIQDTVKACLYNGIASDRNFLLYGHVPFNPLNAELNFICHLLALLRAQHNLHVSRIRVKAGT